MSIVKNFKKAYVASTVVIYFNDDDLEDFSNLHKTIRENTKFIKIGSDWKNNLDKKYQDNLYCNKLDETFLSWDTEKVDESNKKVPMSANSFFNINESKLKSILSNKDLAIIVYKDQNKTVLDYIEKLISYLAKYDVFSFHFIIDSFIKSKKAQKELLNIKNLCAKKRQVIVKISEYNVLQAYKIKNISLDSRNFFSSKFIRASIESFLVPFLDPELNWDHFTIIKKLFYKDTKNFTFPCIPSIGFSDSKIDWIDISLINALSNPIFYGAYKSTNKFLITLKSSYITNKMIERINYIFTEIIGTNVELVISKYISDFDIEIFAQIGIIAIGANEETLIEDKDIIKKDVSRMIRKIEESKNIFDNDETKTLLMDLPFKKLNI
ncbi:MAG: gliding machinery protein P42 [Metamycoplasmataceae bacterium]